MHIGLMEIEFYLEGCRSLKEKRGRLAGLRERYGRLANVAVCESGFQDSHQKSLWSFAAIAVDDKGISRTLNEIENTVESHIDACVVNITRHNL